MIWTPPTHPKRIHAFQRRVARAALAAAIFALGCPAPTDTALAAFGASRPLPGAPVDTTARMPRVALVLSGGGARGLAHVGVLQALEEAGIPIDGIAGVSIGAVVGGLYASGCTIPQLKAIAHRSELFRSPGEYRERNVFEKRVLNPQTFGVYLSGWEYRLPRSLVNDFNLNWMLIENSTPAALAARGSFDRLPIPFRTMAFDLDSRSIVVFRDGDLPRAIRSSMSVPLAFPPIPSRDPVRLFVDPGPVNNLPVDLSREMGCDRVIAVDCTAHPEEGPVSDDPYRVAQAVLQVLSQRVDSLSITGWDVWIKPDLAGRSATDFSRPEELFEAGYRATWAQMDKIRALFPPGTIPLRRPRPTPQELMRSLGPLQVQFVRFEEQMLSYVWVPKRELGFDKGDAFSLDALDRGLRRLYATGNYQAVWPYLSQPDSGRVGILLNLEERVPTYLSFGLLYDNGRSMNLDAELRRDNLLHLGETIYGTVYLGQFQNGLETGVRSSRLRGIPFGLSLRLRAIRDDYSEDSPDQFRHTVHDAQLSTSLASGQDALFMIGLGVRRDRGEKPVGVPDWNDLDRTASVSVIFDNSDERALPTRGGQATLRSEFSSENLSREVVTSWNGSADWSVSAGRLSLIPGVDAAGLNPRGLPFRYWHRLDLTRATLGRFEPGLYAPFAGDVSATVGLRFATNLSFWTRGTALFRGDSVTLLRHEAAEKGLESGLLQRTPIGPVQGGIAWEKSRNAYVFIQVGNDLPPD